MSIRFSPNVIASGALPKALPKALARASRPRSSQYSTHANDRLRVAVLGGGITGLTTAYRLAQNPSTDVTIYEKSNRLGGWLSSERIEVEGGSVLFEWGPRTLRSGGSSGPMATAELLLDLDLNKSVLRTDSRSPAACNRYIYYPDHLVRLPGPRPRGTSLFRNLMVMAISLLSEPLLQGVYSSFVSEHRAPPRDKSVQDESIGDFISRRFSREIADNIASAVAHGIVAGDIYNLSTRALLPTLWEHDITGGVVSGMLAPKEAKFASSDGVELVKLLTKEKGLTSVKALRKFGHGTSVLTLKDGMGEMAGALEETLRGMENVEVQCETEVERIWKKEGGLAVATPNSPETRHDYIVSTIPSPSLAAPLSTNKDLPLTTSLLRQNSSAVTVMVVNLYYPNPKLVPYHGFGYLIPRSIALDQNPERALGVIFASESSVGQDTAPGTKLTVMLGGHWWDDWTPSDLPDEQSAIEMTQTLLKRHLHIDAKPTVAQARLQKNCIPQYTVGHAQRMIDLHEALQDEYNSRLKVAGAWYTGVGVNDCVKSARLAAASVHSQFPGLTGLEKYVKPFVKQAWMDE